LQCEQQQAQRSIVTNKLQLACRCFDFLHLHISEVPAGEYLQGSTRSSTTPSRPDQSLNCKNSIFRTRSERPSRVIATLSLQTFFYYPPSNHRVFPPITRLGRYVHYRNTGPESADTVRRDKAFGRAWHRMAWHACIRCREIAFVMMPQAESFRQPLSYTNTRVQDFRTEVQMRNVNKQGARKTFSNVQITD